MTGRADRQRIDKWLFFARVTRSRSLGAKLAESGTLRVNRNKIDDSAYAVKPGDVLTIPLGQSVLVYRVLGLADSRRPYEEARLLYDDLARPPQSPAKHY